jgi:hypothetical protein
MRGKFGDMLESKLFSRLVKLFKLIVFNYSAVIFIIVTPTKLLATEEGLFFLWKDFSLE